MENLIQRLEERLEQAEYRLKLLSEIADYENHPCLYVAIEADLTEKQVNDIYDLMDQAAEIIKSGKRLALPRIEQGIYEIVPNKTGNYHFVKNIIGALNDEGRWVEVYNHLRDQGLN